MNLSQQGRSVLHYRTKVAAMNGTKINVDQEKE